MASLHRCGICAQLLSQSVFAASDTDYPVQAWTSRQRLHARDILLFEPMGDAAPHYSLQETSAHYASSTRNG